MKQKIQIIRVSYPEKGDYLPEQEYLYKKTEDGLPVIGYEGGLFYKFYTKFSFTRDCIGYRLATDTEVRDHLKSLALKGSMIVLGAVGALANLGLGLASSALITQKGKKGLIVLYNNNKGCSVLSMFVGTPEVIDEIVASMPKDKVILPNSE